MKFYPPFPWRFALILYPFLPKSMENRVRKYTPFSQKHGDLKLHCMGEAPVQFPPLVEMTDNFVIVRRRENRPNIICNVGCEKVLIIAHKQFILRIPMNNARNNPLFQKSMEIYSKNIPFFLNPWSMEEIKKDPLSPWICELACVHILVETEVPGVLSNTKVVLVID